MGRILSRPKARWRWLWRHCHDGDGGNASRTEADAAGRVPGPGNGLALRAHAFRSSTCARRRTKANFISRARGALRGLPRNQCADLPVLGAGDLAVVPEPVSLTPTWVYARPFNRAATCFR